MDAEEAVSLRRFRRAKCSNQERQYWAYQISRDRLTDWHASSKIFVT